MILTFSSRFCSFSFFTSSLLIQALGLSGLPSFSAANLFRSNIHELCLNFPSPLDWMKQIWLTHFIEDSMVPPVILYSNLTPLFNKWFLFTTYSTGIIHVIDMFLLSPRHAHTEIHLVSFFSSECIEYLLLAGFSFFHLPLHLPDLVYFLLFPSFPQIFFPHGNHPFFTSTGFIS